ncbi:MAG: histidine--tRNA ligase [Candidatus Shapirobacteria bacterium]
MKNKGSKIQPLKGFRDFLPEDMAIRQKVIDTLREVFEAFGFVPLESPALEYSEVLLGKYGKEADKLVYSFKDQGKRDIGLRYDLTVPVSRILAQYQNKIIMPFKRYQIQPVWRAEKPQKGRYREFVQCDADIFGVNSPLADAEIIALIFQGLKSLKLNNFQIKINSRQVLFELMAKANVPKEKQLRAIIILDKLPKKGKKLVEQELADFLSSDIARNIIKLISKANPDNYLQAVLDLLLKYNLPAGSWMFEPSLARGLDYYTGPIFETVISNSAVGSITGGGRYDNLVSQLGGPQLVAIGTTFGLDRIIEVIRKDNLWPDLPTAQTKVLITVFLPGYLDQSLKTVSRLREKKINSEIYLEPNARLNKQLKYADKKGIPWVVILGPEEIKEKKILLKNMKTGDQEKVSLEKAIGKLSQN